ncbi:MAG: hypothetical protein WCX16_06390 [Candidatus Omnitrophota bacterium]
MKGIIILFLCVFIFIWGFGMAVSYVQQMQRNAIDVKPDYGDFSPQKIEDERKQAMDDYKKQLKDYKNQQSSYKSQQDAQKKFMEDQKRQMKDMQRVNQAR